MGLRTFMKYLISYREHTLTLTYLCKTKKLLIKLFLRDSVVF